MIAAGLTSLQLGFLDPVLDDTAKLRVEVTVDGESVWRASLRGAEGAAALDDLVLSLDALPAESVRIAISTKTRGAGAGAFLDVLVGGPAAASALLAVPEPGTGLLWPLLALALARRKR